MYALYNEYAVEKVKRELKKDLGKNCISITKLNETHTHTAQK